MAGQDDDRHINVSFDHLPLHFHAIHIGHTHIQEDTTAIGFFSIFQKGGAGLKLCDPKTGVAEHETGCMEDSNIIIDNMNELSVGHQNSTLIVSVSTIASSQSVLSVRFL